MEKRRNNNVRYVSYRIVAYKDSTVMGISDTVTVKVN